MKETGRYDYIDIAKGIGIICVVFGHLGIWFKYFYLFHMPLFFFISGFLYKSNGNFKEYLKSKAKQLLIPYIAFLTLVYAIQVYFETKTAIPDFKEIVLIILRFILGGKWLAGFTTVFWFITCLFATQVTYNYLSHKYPSKKMWVLMALSLLISYFNAACFKDLRVPWNLNAIFFTLPIYHLGHIYKNISLKFNVHILWLIIISSIGFFLAWINKSNYLDIKNCIYGIPFVTIFFSIVISIFVLRLSHLIAKIKYLSFVLVNIGKASLVIMYLHQCFNTYFSSLLQVKVFFIGILTICVCLCLYKIMNAFPKTQFIFLGSKKNSPVTNNKFTN